MTQFEQAQAQVKEGSLKVPSVSMGSSNIDYFGYQLATHRFNLKVMSSGMKFKGITFTQIKKYYGLKGKSAKDCLPQFEQIINDYKQGLL
jgi:hypothetical protein